MRRAAPILVLVVSAVALVLGWREFWFLCDDAYIEFRYVSSAQRGWGYVWNPPPWRPVEGYTSFLWVALLDAAWTITGVQPPEAAPVLSLLFSFVSLGIVAWMAWRVAPPAWRVPVLVAVLGCTLSNRTFLAWTSSGLETAMVTSLVLAWVALAIVRRARPLFGLCAVAGALALARPDGLLYVAATGAIVALRAWRAARAGGVGGGGAGREGAGAGGARAAAGVLLAAAPLLAPVVHVAWRLSFYGYPLPNTYYAKHVGAWPLSGAIYLGAFLLEYAYWVWLGAVGVAAVAAVRAAGGPAGAARRVAAVVREALGRPGGGAASVGGGAGAAGAASGAADPGEAAADRVVVWIGVATLLGHFGYYTFLVGGDHFEFRVYHAFVPLLPLAFFAMYARFGWGRRGVAAFVFMTALGLVLPWTHWWHTRTAVGHKEAGSFKFPVAAHVVAPLRPYAAAWDALQAWSLDHFVGIRHQGHRTYLWYQASRYPDRADGARISGEGNPVLVASAVGYPAWSMPEVAVLDRLGLNDLVVARTPAKHTGQTDRRMAHDRAAPRAYVQCFRPNVEIDAQGRVTVRERELPLSDDAIRACEDEWLARVSQ